MADASATGAGEASRLRRLWCTLRGSLLSARRLERRRRPRIGALAATALALAASGASCRSAAHDSGAALPVIPVPARAERLQGAFRVGPDTAVASAPEGPARQAADHFVGLVQRTLGLALPQTIPAERATGAIVFVLRPEDARAGAEAYELEVTPAGITIGAADPRGLFYGGVTLWQLLSAAGAPGPDVDVPAVRVSDAPRFAWRGMMLDVARHHVPVGRIKALLDAMALQKLNVFHWHLTDDQGWRLEIRKHPRLTQVGAWRVPAGAAAAADIDPATGRPRLYGGYYTQDEVRDIVRYAAERHITVVPEIEMPGHAQAAIAAYPHLGTEGPPPPVSSDWGVHDRLFNVEESTFAFLEDVLTEVLELFPGEYVHVGGDEAVKDRWRASERIQQRMRELGVPDEQALQGYFVARIERFLAAHGRRLIGWDEILEGGLPPRAAVMSWRGIDGAITAARDGHDVVLAPAPVLYLDYLQSDAPDEPPGRARHVTLADVYAFDPLPAELAGPAARHVLGAQLNAWTEHMRTPERIEHNAFPRLAALAEVLWSPPARRGWEDFLHRLGAQLERYRQLGVAHADSAFAVRISSEDRAASGALRVRLATQSGVGEIRYTLNGAEPSATSSLYRGDALELELPATVHAATFVGGRRMSRSRARAFDRDSLRRRSSDELATCGDGLTLRLEDDAPLAGERAVFKVDLLEQCWIYAGADLTGVTAVRAAVGQVPFNFQLGKDVEAIGWPRAETPHGELEVRLGDCGGERIASLPLAPAAARHDVTVLPGVRVAPRAGRHDLCFAFARHGLDPMWVIDWFELIVDGAVDE